MTETLHMIQLALESRATLRFARERGLHWREDDVGYVLHTVLREAFQEAAPQPFVLTSERGGRMQVLGYAREDHRILLERLHSFARPELFGLIDPASVCSKAMPTGWPAGQRLAFEVRACPVVRQSKGGTGGRAREVDIFLAEAIKTDKALPVRRDAVYRSWITAQLERDDAARDVSVRLAAFRRRRLARRDARRSLHASEKPDATFHGEFTVGDPQAFAALLRRGVGRHRAFGFGMVLLRPPRTPESPGS